jgi:diaminopimelate epimerase
MRIPFTKMQGAGNDFVVLDETRKPLGLRAAHYRFLGDRHFGVGADQILSVRPSPGGGIDFSYAIHNADGDEVEHCGNGARCFLKYVRERRLVDKDTVTVQTMNRVLELQWQSDGRVAVDMQAPVFELAALPFEPAGLSPQPVGAWEQWPLALDDNGRRIEVRVALVSMGNPHAVLLVDDTDAAPVGTWGPLVQAHAAFPRGVNVGFLQVLDRTRVRLRVYERGAGETLACGTGACAAVVAGVRLGVLDASVEVLTLGGPLTIEWGGGITQVRMTGPATTVFEGEIDLPDNL